MDIQSTAYPPCNAVQSPVHDKIVEPYFLEKYVPHNKK